MTSQDPTSTRGSAAASDAADAGDSQRIAIEHVTRYAYEHPARASFNEARLRPLTEQRPGVTQALLDHRVRVHPRTHSSEYDDYWGTHVVAFEVQRPHDALEVQATSLVDLAAAPVQPVPPVSWETMRERATVEEFCEYLAISELTEPPQELAELAAQCAQASDPAAAACAIMTSIHERMTYQPGSTGVHTAARDAWQEGRGVCQDIAQLSVGALRSAGIPARYVSGYLHPDPSAGVGVKVSGQSHAWVEYWTGSWMGFDPTNDSEPGLHHIVVGRGREYRDVKPLHGVVSHGAAGELTVAVTISRIS